jgi:hypothetical protein
MSQQRRESLLVSRAADVHEELEDLVARGVYHAHGLHGS